MIIGTIFGIVAFPFVAIGIILFILIRYIFTGKI